MINCFQLLIQFQIGALHHGEGVTAPNPQGAADWYRRAADVGHGGAANNFSNMYTVGRGRAPHIIPATSRSTTRI